MFTKLRHGSVDYYRQGLFVLFLFTLFFTLFFEDKSKKNGLMLQSKSNQVVFIFLMTIIIYIFIFGIDRSQATFYTVKYSPLYEYSIIIFLFAILYANTRKKKIIVTIFIFLFIIQDIIWGGRVTSLQLILLLSFTIFYDFLTTKRLLLFFVAGLLCLSAVGIYRVRYDFEGNLIAYAFAYLKKSWFVLDTATYAYGASVTQLHAEQFASIPERITSFFNYFLYIFWGGFLSMSDFLGRETITRVDFFAREHYFHYGGGLFPFYFHFWFGWIGPIFAGILLAKFISFFSKQQFWLWKLFFLLLLITVPRWYLYTPINAFRPFLFFIIVYAINNFLESLQRNIVFNHNKDESI